MGRRSITILISILLIVSCTSTPEKVVQDTLVMTATEAKFSKVDSALHYEIDLTYPVIDANLEPDILNSINNTVSEKFYDFADQNNFIAAHENLPEEFYSKESDWVGLLQNTYGISQCDSILSIWFSFYQYFGGAAHGFTKNQSLQFNIHTGAVIPLSDFFMTDTKSISKIRAIINTNLPDTLCWGIEHDSSTLSTINNFSFTNEQIIFKFNDYTLCPYALGLTSIAFDKADFKNVMKIFPEQNCQEILAVQDEGEIATH